MEHRTRQTQYWWPTSWSLHVDLITGNRLNPQYQPPCSLPTHAPHSRLIEQLTSYLPSCSTEDCCISVPHFSLPGSILQRLEMKVLFLLSISLQSFNIYHRFCHVVHMQTKREQRMNNFFQKILFGVKKTPVLHNRQQ